MKLMVDVFTVSHSCIFLVMKAMRGKRFFQYFMNFMLAVDCEMMDDNIHEFFVFIQRLLFPVNSGERPLRQNDMSILDFLFSDLFKNACIRNIRADENFLGGSTFLTQMLEDMKEERRRNPEIA